MFFPVFSFFEKPMEKTLGLCTPPTVVMAESAQILPIPPPGHRLRAARPDVLYQQALTLHRVSRLEEAESIYRQILQAEPNHPGALHFLGMLRLTQGDPSEALQLIERSLHFCNTKAVYYNNYGAVLNEWKQYHEAKTAFENALVLDPNYPDALSNLGLVSEHLGEPGHIAEHHFRSALQLQPNHRDAMRHLVDLLLKNERYEESLPFLERQVTLEPDNAELRHRLGVSFGESGKISDAKREFQKAASLPGGKAVWKWKHLWYCPVFFENESEVEKYWQNLNRDIDAALEEKPVYDWRTLPYDGFTHSFQLPHHDRCCREVLEKFTKLFAPSFPFERPTYKLYRLPAYACLDVVNSM